MLPLACPITGPVNFLLKPTIHRSAEIDWKGSFSTHNVVSDAIRNGVIRTWYFHLLYMKRKDGVAIIVKLVDRLLPLRRYTSICSMTWPGYRDRRIDQTLSDQNQPSISNFCPDFFWVSLASVGGISSTKAD